MPVNVPKEVKPKLKKILDQSDEFTIAEIYQHAANLKISNVECRNWLLLHGARIRAVPSSKIIAGKPRCRFFDDLLYETKIALLKKTRHIGNVRVITAAMVQELANELYLPLVPLKNWLKNKRRRDQTCARQLSKEVVASLKMEYEKCNYLDEDQALFLAYELNSPSTLIKKWFINQRFKEQKSQIAKSKPVGKVRRFARKTVEQKNILFEVFKNSPNYIGRDKLRDIEKMTNLNARQITKWLSCIRVKWAKCTKSQLKKDLTKNFSQELLTTFENEYQKNKFLVNESEFMKRTGKSIFVLRSWFSKRRLYELRSGGLSLIEAFNEAKKSNKLEKKEATAETKCEAGNDIEFFKKLPQSLKIRLFKACKDDSPMYEQLSQDIGVSVDVVKEWIANRKQNSNLENEPGGDQEVTVDVPLAHEPVLNLRRLFAQKNILFEEFKKQPKLSLSKVKALSNRLHLTTLQIRKWFYNYQKMLNKHTREKVFAIVKDQTFPPGVLIKLEEIYNKKNRFIAQSEAEEMAARFGLTRGQVKNWFVFARYYEILTGCAPNSKPAFSASLNSFLNKLEPVKQKRLIDELKHYPFGHEKIIALSEELNLSINDLQNWFEKSLSSNLTIKQKMAKSNRMNFPKIQALKFEFLKDPELTPERTRALSMRYKISMERLREWFERRKTTESVEKQVDQPEESETEAPTSTIEMQLKTLKTPVICVPKTNISEFFSPPSDKRNYKMPIQQNQLFDEFKISPYLSNEKLGELIDQTGLLGKQINAWFQWMRIKLSGINKETLTEENRNSSLSPGLIAILEQEYSENRYLSTEAREKLATETNLTKSFLKSWFTKRRYYELLGESSTEDEFEKSRIPSEIENIQIDEDASEMDPVETVIIYDWEVEAGTNESETQENFITTGDDDSKTNFDRSILIAQAPAADDKRARVFTLLDADLEPVEKNIDDLFWFLRKNPKDQQPSANETIDAEKDAYLEKELEKNPWKTMDEIVELSNKLNVSETMIHWWFIKKRCLLTKTVLTFKIEPPKSLYESSPFIELADEDTINQIFNEPEKLNAQDFEFVALNENEIKQENYVDESGIENQADPMAVDQDDKSSNVKEESKNVPTLKKKKKKVPLTSHQRSILMQEFKRCKYISGTKARMLANDLGLSVNRVDMWFENMRKSSEKKSDETATAKDKAEKLASSIVEALEAEFQKSSNFSEKRLKLIAYKLNISAKMVRRWVFQKIKSRNNDAEK